MPYGITQRLRWHSQLYPSKADNRFNDPGGMQGWVAIAGYLHTEMVYRRGTGTNRARCRVSVFIRWMSLTAYYGPVSVCTLSIRLSKATTVRIRVTHCCTCRLAFYLYCGQLNWPVVWHCWLGIRKGAQPVKKLSGCLSGARCHISHHIAYGPADATTTHCLLLQ